jgi:lipoate-protein ligase A
MAIDEALFDSVAAGSSPVLRFYSWNQPTLSLGNFQDYKKVVDEAFSVHNNISVVRRITGGRAVLHHREVTYAIAAPLDRGLFRERSLKQTYELIAEAWKLALRQMGVDSALIALQSQPQSPRSGGGQCFVSVSQFELSARERKVIGSAQKRVKDRFLQHGSILLDFDARLQAGCIQHPDPAIESRIAPINRLLGREVSFEEIVRTFASAFEATLGVTLQPADLSANELQRTAELEPRYAGKEWTVSGCR